MIAILRDDRTNYVAQVMQLQLTSQHHSGAEVSTLSLKSDDSSFSW
jgi:hypothetical protein